MDALIEALGTVEAERFIAAVSRDRFDYTEWRRTGLPDLTLEHLSDEAMRVSVQLDKVLGSVEFRRATPGDKA